LVVAYRALGHPLHHATLFFHAIRAAPTDGDGAAEALATYAGAQIAVVLSGTYISIVARTIEDGVVNDLALHADVLGAGVQVIQIFGHSDYTGPVITVVTRRAVIGVIITDDSVCGFLWLAIWNLIIVAAAYVGCAWILVVAK